jgi:hypothetical protein
MGWARTPTKERECRPRGRAGRNRMAPRREKADKRPTPPAPNLPRRRSSAIRPRFLLRTVQDRSEHLCDRLIRWLEKVPIDVEVLRRRNRCQRPGSPAPSSYRDGAGCVFRAAARTRAACRRKAYLGDWPPLAGEIRTCSVSGDVITAVDLQQELGKSVLRFPQSMSADPLNVPSLAQREVRRMDGLRWSYGGAPGKIRTCAHGLGNRCSIP